nr:nucleotidyltransferase family protein [Pseudomonas sp. SO81]
MTAGLVLAAGSSARFGSDKRKAEVCDGTTLLSASLRLPSQYLEEVWLVLRPDDDPRDLNLPHAVRVIQDPATARGMGHSLAVGATQITRLSAADSLAVFLGDMPGIKSSSLMLLLSNAASDRITVPTYNGSRGHPVLFGRVFWCHLSALTGDQGARSVLNRFAESVHLVETGDPGILSDVDSIQDLTALVPRSLAH